MAQISPVETSEEIRLDSRRLSVVNITSKLSSSWRKHDKKDPYIYEVCRKNRYVRGPVLATCLESFVCEFFLELFGFFWSPVCVWIMGLKGSIAMAFFPGTMEDGKTNVHVFLWMQAIWIFLSSILLDAALPFFVEGHVATVNMTYDVMFILLMHFSRSIAISLKYAMLPRKEFLRIKKSGRTMQAANMEMMISFALKSKPAILFDMLAKSFLAQEESLCLHTFYFSEPMNPKEYRQIHQEYAEAKADHQREFGLSELNTADQMKRKDDDDVVVEKEDGQAEETNPVPEEDTSSIEIGVYLYHLVWHAFQQGNQTFAAYERILIRFFRAYMVFEILLGGIYLYQVECNNRAWQVFVRVAVFFLRSFYIWNVNMFVLASCAFFSSKYKAMAALVRMLQSEYKRDKSRSSQSSFVFHRILSTSLEEQVAKLDKLWCPNLFAWMFAFDVLRKFGSSMAFRYDIAVINQGFCIVLVALSSMVELGKEEVMAFAFFCLFLYMELVSMVTLGGSILQASRINKLQDYICPRLLISFRSDVERALYSYKYEVPNALPRTTSLDTEELIKLRARIGGSEKVILSHLVHVRETILQVAQRIKLGPRVVLLGTTVTDKNIKSVVVLFASIGALSVNIYRMSASSS